MPNILLEPVQMKLTQNTAKEISTCQTEYQKTRECLLNVQS